MTPDEFRLTEEKFDIELSTVSYHNPEMKAHVYGQGEWTHEPDEVFFLSKDFQCRIKRNYCGAWCGYVCIGDKHPWRNMKYEEIPAEVHGGLTYGELNTYHDMYEIGFDCGHSGDLMPSFEKSKKEVASQWTIKSSLTNSQQEEIDRHIKEYRLKHPPVYRNFAFCIEECKSLVNQAIETINKGDKADGS